jgi:putrescine aminotransferase
MKSTRRDSIDSFRKHVNPEEASLLKLANVDKMYTRALGTRLWDDEGRAYLDFTAGYGALNLGHNNPEVLAAVREAASLPSVLLAGYNPLMGALARNLSLILPGELSHTSFGSGGAEAVELALKTARASTGRKKFVSCANGYHGLSFGALSVGGAERYCEALGPFLNGCETVPFADLPALEEKLRGRDVAGFIIEPIQGEGGAIVPPAGYLKGVEEVCRKYGTLLILDEIQTGFGRTGKLFALEHDRVTPDIITLSKSLGGGVVPISASVTTEDIWKSAFGKRDRFDLVVSTFGGHAAACAAALKAIEIALRDELPSKADELGRYSMKRLEELKSKHRAIKEIRGKGLLLGIELESPRIPGANMDENYSAMVISRLLNDHRILTSYYDLDTKVVRFEPPLIVTKQEIDQAVEAIDDVLGRRTSGLVLSFGKSVMSRMVNPP